jgi:hypothetical protein
LESVDFLDGGDDPRWQQNLMEYQIGKYERAELPKTGLAAFTPAIAYAGPSSQGCERGVTPDVPIAISEVVPGATLNSLVSWIDANQAAR